MVEYIKGCGGFCSVFWLMGGPFLGSLRDPVANEWGECRLYVYFCEGWGV